MNTLVSPQKGYLEHSESGFTMQHISPYAVRIKSRHTGFGQESICVDKNDILLLLRNKKRQRLNQVLFERLISEANNTESSLLFYIDLMLLTQFFFCLVKTSVLDLLRHV